ncbi:DinB family protein [Chitinophaga sp. NPDC101104]|uniref:DinB family protein n=1 Tax=Chitinophaga sp. NPDC101104 TaxID=3390561 RepID=UPI003D04E1D4
MNTQDVAQAGKVAAWLLLYDGHTPMFNNVLEGISEADARKRLDTPANHPIWLAGSLVQERFEMANALGLKEQQQAHLLFDNHKGIQADAEYPSLDTLRADWARITPILREAFSKASAEKLHGPNPWPMPDMEQISLLDMLLYCIDRESYCIGQLGLWRRLLNYPPMRYS